MRIFRFFIFNSEFLLFLSNSVNLFEFIWVDILFRPPSSQTATVAPRCFPGLTFPDFDLGIETKRKVWLLRTGFGIVLVNKLVSLTWLLWALRSFRGFTLHSVKPLEMNFSHRQYVITSTGAYILRADRCSCITSGA